MTGAPHPRSAESGNVIFYILIAIVLIGVVTAAMRYGGGTESANIDQEQALIHATQIRSYANDLERAVIMIVQNGTSESDIRFAHPDAPSAYGSLSDEPTRQVFARNGGGVEYKLPPRAVNRAVPWEFYATTTFPLVGSGARGDLAAVLPNVNEAVCRQLNRLAGLPSDATPLDTSTCIYSGATGRFNGTYTDSSPNVIDSGSLGSFTTPVTQACLRCDDGRYHFYHVLLGR